MLDCSEIALESKISGSYTYINSKMCLILRSQQFYGNNSMNKKCCNMYNCDIVFKKILTRLYLRGTIWQSHEMIGGGILK